MAAKKGIEACETGKAREKSHGFVARRAARATAVQAVYQALITQTPLARVGDEFLTHRMDSDHFSGAADPDLFASLVEGIENHRHDIDALIQANMPEERPVARQLPLLMAILQCGGAELLACPETPANIIINEYMEVANGFFSNREPAFINAVLDRLAKTLRPTESIPSENNTCPG